MEYNCDDCDLDCTVIMKGICVKSLINECKELQAENTKLQEALERIKTWSEAYPLKAFPKPDLKKAREVLEAAGMTLDSISADAMRHVINGVKNIVEQALKE